MKRFTTILLVALTAFALIGSPRVYTMSGCSPVEPFGSTDWCAQ
jgi:hypothetical protein